MANAKTLAAALNYIASAERNLREARKLLNGLAVEKATKPRLCGECGHSERSHGTAVGCRVGVKTSDMCPCLRGPDLHEFTVEKAPRPGTGIPKVKP